MSIQHIDSLLLDLDGLLIDTEGFHYRAYKQMCQMFGYDLTWDLNQYLSIAGASSTHLQESLKAQFPGLFEKHTWAELYAIKQKNLFDLLENEPIPLMPHVEEGFTLMVQTGLPIAVVTNSSRRILQIVQSSHPLFSPVHLWIAREDYDRPKPDPDCYRTALHQLQCSPSKALGFEDTFRGICALRAAGCKAVLINAMDQHVQKECRKMKVAVYSSFECIPTVLFAKK